MILGTSFFLDIVIEELDEKINKDMEKLKDTINYQDLTDKECST